MSNVFPGHAGSRGDRYHLAGVNFNLPLLPAIALAPAPGTHNDAAMAWYGRLGFNMPCRIDAIHLHLDVDGTGASWDLEVYRYRPSDGTHTMIATCSLASGGGDNGFKKFTFVSDGLKDLLAGDYLRLQATAKMTGAGTVGFVDVHTESLPLV